jgi:hypothetical protein
VMVIHRPITMGVDPGRHRDERNPRTGQVVTYKPSQIVSYTLLQIITPGSRRFLLLPQECDSPVIRDWGVHAIGHDATGTFIVGHRAIWKILRMEEDWTKRRGSWRKTYGWTQRRRKKTSEEPNSIEEKKRNHRTRPARSPMRTALHQPRMCSIQYKLAKEKIAWWIRQICMRKEIGRPWTRETARSNSGVDLDLE